MATVITVCVTILLPTLTNAQGLLDRQVDILQTYPPTARDGTQSLYMAVMQSFSGGWVSAGGVPAIQLALDDINANDSVLPEYTLKYQLTDTKVCGHRKSFSSRHIFVYRFVYEVIVEAMRVCKLFAVGI